MSIVLCVAFSRPKRAEGQVVVGSASPPVAFTPGSSWMVWRRIRRECSKVRYPPAPSGCRRDASSARRQARYHGRGAISGHFDGSGQGQANRLRCNYQFEQSCNIHPRGVVELYLSTEDCVDLSVEFNTSYVVKAELRCELSSDQIRALLRFCYLLNQFAVYLAI